MLEDLTERVLEPMGKETARVFDAALVGKNGVISGGTVEDFEGQDMAVIGFFVARVRAVLEHGTILQGSCFNLQAFLLFDGFHPDSRRLTDHADRVQV